VRGHRPVVQLLLEAGANPNTADNHGQTPLFLALKLGKLDLVRTLIEGGGDVNLQSRSGFSLLHDAVKRGDVALTRLILTLGPDLDARTVDGWTPLIAAVQKDLEIVRLLLNAGADVNAASRFGYTSLQRAAAQNKADVVKLLLERGADVHAVDAAGKSAIDFAETAKSDEVISLLTSVVAASPKPNRPQRDDVSASFSMLETGLELAEHAMGGAIALGGVRFGGGEGTSAADAVVIHASSIHFGVTAEYEYLKRVFGQRQPTDRVDGVAQSPPKPGCWKLVGVACVREGGRSLDRAEILLPDGGKRSVFFDISSFFDEDNCLPIFMAHAMMDR
jgi:hypothetical protein